MAASEKPDLFRQYATQALRDIIDNIQQTKIDSKLLRGYTLPMDAPLVPEFINTYINQTDTALTKLLIEPDDEANIYKAPPKNKKNDLQKLLANYSIVDDDALALQLLVERKAKVLHEQTRPTFCLLSLRMEKLASRHFDIVQNPLHPVLLWYAFRETYERTLSSKYDRKTAVRYWTQLLNDDDWVQLLSNTYKEWLEQLNKWLVTHSVLPYADNEDVRARFLRKEQEREQAQSIRNNVISTITGSAVPEAGAAPNTNVIYQQLSQLIENYKPASAMAPHMITGNVKGKKLDQQTFTSMIQNVNALSVSQMSPDAETGYLQDSSTENLAQALRHYTDVNNLSIDKRTQTTVALLSMIFDQLKNEENIATPIKALMSGLKMPVLDSALKDEQFFTDVDNPAQQLVGEFARVGSYWSPKPHAERDIVYKKMLSIVEDVQQNYHNEEDIFEHSLQELLEFLDNEEYKSSLLSERVIEAERARARAKLAREMAQTLIAEHVGGQKLPLLTSKFLGEHWQQVLFFNLNQNPDIHTEAMQRALKSLDELVAAAKGSTSIDLFKLLVDIRNQLLEHGSDFPERKEALRNLFLELKVIASAVTKVQAEILAQDTHVVESEAASMPDLPLQDIVGAAVEMVSVDLPLAKKPDAKPRPVAIVDAFTEIANNLHNNVWFKFQQGRNTIKIKLAAIIRASDTYIFINNNGQKIFSDTHDGVTSRLRSGNLVPVAESAYFDRALQSVVKSLRQ